MKSYQIIRLSDLKVMIPLVTETVPAGFPSPAQGYEEERLDITDLISTNTPATFYIKVRGESMLDANIFPGDILVVDRSIEPIHGKIVIAIVNGEFTVKELYSKDGIVKLVPANPEYPEIVLDNEEQLEIWGVVSYTIHKN